MKQSHHSIKSVAVIGNYLPRQCGIATFTTDLVDALSSQRPDSECWAVAMNDKPECYAYPEKVRFEIAQNNLKEYRSTAEFLNINQVGVVCLQHEFGIFGGPAGNHILTLLSNLRLPVVTTLHTVLSNPSADYRETMLRLAKLSDRLIVMSHKAIDILQTVYKISPQKITCIPHGTPDLSFVDPNNYKAQFGVSGKKMLLTFGLLSRNKGIEYALRALPKVIERFPDIVYIVLGATHPQILQADGDVYRLYLQQIVQNLGLEKHVVFQNRFVSLPELIEYLAATDIYISPYIDEAQISSGTLAYAMATGKAVISTPYWYAKEMLDEGRGLLTPFRDSGAISEALIELLGNDDKHHAICKQAYNFSRQATWETVAEQYFQVFGEVSTSHKRRPPDYPSKPLQIQQPLSNKDLPPLKLDHLFTMTDDTGLLQHAKYNVPDLNHGYCTDDNARAIIVAAQAQNLLAEQTGQYKKLSTRYLAFLMHAFNSEIGRFRNFMAYNRSWLESYGSEDSHGRALWGLGSVAALRPNSHELPVISALFKKAIPAAEKFQSPRSIAFSLLGAYSYLNVYSGDSQVRRALSIFANRLFDQFNDGLHDDWPWPESTVSYDNAKLPHALLLGGQWLNNGDMSRLGLRALEWLFDLQTQHGYFVPVGNNGWLVQGKSQARFDQQPLEAQSMIDACLAAYRLSQDNQWLVKAKEAFNWFLGKNDLDLPLFDAKTGGCRDGLTSNGVNENQGAESTLAWLMSLAQLHSYATEELVISQSLSESGLQKQETLDAVSRTRQQSVYEAANLNISKV